jgi:deoxyinosine 3'endonuclease (endonuclease V)
MIDGEDCNSSNMESQRQVWLKEQLAIAAKVKVLPDDDDDNDDASENEQEQTPSQSMNRQDFFILSTSNTILQQRQQGPAHEQFHDEKPSNVCCDNNYYFGGVDVSFSNDDLDAEQASGVAVYVIIDARTMTIAYKDHEYFQLNGVIPYIPSFLAFREIDPLVRLILKQIHRQPEWTPCAILVDGNGILHARKAGLACFVGVRTGIPTIGVAKTLYCHGGLTERIVRRGIHLSIQRAMQHHHRDVLLMGNKAPTRTSTETMLLWDRKPIRAPEEIIEDSSTTSMSCYSVESSSSPINDNAIREGEAWIRSLPSSCLGLAIPLETRCIKDCNVTEGSVESIDNFEVLASVLVGHGGRGGGGSANKKGVVGRTKSPIFISVGHGISLRNAGHICAHLSLFRIPEPVRQADLMGRALLRQWKR